MPDLYFKASQDITPPSKKPRQNSRNHFEFLAKIYDVRKHNPKTVVPVDVGWIVPVAIRTAGVPVIIVERTTAQNTIL